MRRISRVMALVFAAACFAGMAGCSTLTAMLTGRTGVPGGKLSAAAADTIDGYRQELRNNPKDPQAAVYRARLVELETAQLRSAFRPTVKRDAVLYDSPGGKAVGSAGYMTFSIAQFGDGWYGVRVTGLQVAPKENEPFKALRGRDGLVPITPGKNGLFDIAELLAVPGVQTSSFELTLDQENIPGARRPGPDGRGKARRAATNHHYLSELAIHAHPPPGRAR